MTATDERVTIERVRSIYQLDETFAASLIEWWDVVGSHIGNVSREVLTHQAMAPGYIISDDDVRVRVRYAKGKLSQSVDQEWVDRIVKVGQDLAQEGTDFAAVTGGLVAAYRQMHSLVFCNCDDVESLGRMTWAMLQLALIESQIIGSEITQFSKVQAREERHAHATAFEQDVASAVSEAATAGESVREMVQRAAAAIGEMLLAAQQVVSTAEQSAKAMADAALNSALVFGAIELAVDEAKASEAIAERASIEVDRADDGASALSVHGNTVDSIVEFIRGVTRQTNMLALNATIEAAHAGESGTSFAVVAQQVKILSNETLGAAQKIAGQVSAIQDAVELMISATSAVKQSIKVVSDSCSRIRETLGMQAKAVFTITESISQTATGARSTVATAELLQSSTTSIANDMAIAEENVKKVDLIMKKLKGSTQSFLKLVNE